MSLAFEGTERFRVLRQLGVGGMGVVYEALDQERNARIALKTLRDLHASKFTAAQMQAFVDQHPDFEVPVERLATWDQASLSPFTLPVLMSFRAL